MSLFSFIGSIFKPAADLIDEIHVSDEERGRLRNAHAQIEAEVSIKVMELQHAAIEANSKVAIAEQEHGDAFTKKVRPIGYLIGVLLGGLQVGAYYLYQIPVDPTLMGFATLLTGGYAVLRTYEKSKK